MTDFLSKDDILEYNRIIDRLYDYDDYEVGLKNFLHEIQSLVPFDKGDIYVYKHKNEHISFESYMSVGYGNELESYQKEYCEIDDALSLISVPQPVMFRSSDVFLLDERKKTNYYKKHLDPAEMHHSIEGNIHVEENGYIVGIGIHKSRDKGDFDQKHLSIMKMTRPHLSRIAGKLCESRADNPKLFDTSSILSNLDEIGIWMMNWKGELIEKEVGDSILIRKHDDELNNIITKLCISLRGNIEKDRSKKKSSYKMKSKIIISDISYYVDIIYRPEVDKTEGVFAAILYDYTGIIDNILDEMKSKYNLTEREYDVFQCLVKGMSNQEIRDRLFISMPTVKKHLTSIYQKLGVDGRHQLINSIL